MEKIGEVNLGDFSTTFRISHKTKEYLNNEQVAFAFLLPNGWEWYESELFDIIDKDRDGCPDKYFGKNFEVIYYGIIEKMDFIDGKATEEGFVEDVELNGIVLNKSWRKINSTPKNPQKSFMVKYYVVQKDCEEYLANESRERELEEKINSYLKNKYSNDLTLTQLYEEIELGKEDLGLLNLLLDEMVKKGKLIKSYSRDNIEYDVPFD